MKKSKSTVLAAFKRLRSALNPRAYFFLLFGYYSGAIGGGTIKVLVGALNTNPVPNLGLRQLLAALAFEHSPKGNRSATEYTLAEWNKVRKDAGCPETCPLVEKKDS